MFSGNLCRVTYGERRIAVLAIIVSTLACLFFAFARTDGGADTASAAIENTGSVTDALPTPTAVSVDVAATPTTPGAATGDVEGTEDSAFGACTIGQQSVRSGATGDSVVCIQNALIAAGLYAGAATGQFDDSTAAAVRRLQTSKDMFVDGFVGRETALSLGIWPDESSSVIHTPAPPAGAVDPLGYKMSTVSSSGADAPALPENSGSGRRIVYSRLGQRVWAVDRTGTVVRSWLVAGSKYSNEEPGVHKVYSKSERSTAWNGKAWLSLMVRYQKTDIGAIGFHGIPIHVADNTPYMTEAELGQRLSGGCQRQANTDAKFMWDFATIGTTVVVL